MVFSQNSVEQGVILMEQEQWNDAISQFEGVLENGTDEKKMVHLNLAYCYYKLGDLDNSLDNWAKSFVLAPSDADVQEFRLVKIAEAVQAFQSFLDEDAENTNAMFSLGKIYYYTYDLDQSYQFLNRALQIDPSMGEVRKFQRNIIVPDSLRKIGQKAFNAGDLNTSDDVFTKLSKIYPGYSMSYYYLGMSQFARKNDANAVQWIENAIQLEQNEEQKEKYRADLTNRVKNYYQDGLTEHRRGNLLGAKEKYLSAVSLDASFYLAHTQLGWLFLKEGNENSAQQSFEDAVRANPDYAKSYYGLGICLYKQGSYEKSLVALKNATKIDDSYE